MQLSKAIRKGATIRPQIAYLLFGRLPTGEIGSCAMGAAYEAAGMTAAVTSWEMESPASIIHTMSWDRILKREVACPVGRTHFAFPCSIRPVHHMICHLNNDHDWTRERIADWVETIEDRLLLPNHQQEAARHEQAEELPELVSA